MMTIALVHMIFNIATMLIFVWIIGLVCNLAMIVIKDKKEDDELAKVLDESIIVGTPSVALQYAKSGIFVMSDLVYQYLKTIRQYQVENKSKLFDLSEEIENKLDDYDQRLHKYLIELVQKNDLSEDETLRFTGYLHIINDLERIGDHLNNIGEILQNRYENGVLTNEVMHDELKQFYGLVEEMMTNSFAALSKRDLKLATQVVESEKKADAFEKEFKHAHSERLRTGELVLAQENTYPDILSNLERIADHLTNISETVITIYEAPVKKATVFGR